MTLIPQLISYIAPAAPATRRPASGDEPFLRPEIGFTPKWYHQALAIDFGQRWHTDPEYRRETVLEMRAELRRHFPGTYIGLIDQPDTPLDLLTGTYGACTVAAIYDIPIIYTPDNWPTCAHQYFNEEEIDRLEPPDLDNNNHFQTLMSQIDRIADKEGRVQGYINWQGVLNNAQRLCGQALFMDMMTNPKRCRHLFDCVCTTMIEAAKRLYKRQKETGVDVRFFTMSNCLVNIVSAQHYAELLLPFDQRISEAFEYVGIHNCAWNANPYLELYANVPRVGYIDMGKDSDLEKARALFPNSRRAIMYTPMDLARKPLSEIRSDLERIARDFGPCDIVAADIEAGTPDDRILSFIGLCQDISMRLENKG
jgi:hypothetical protein